MAVGYSYVVLFLIFAIGFALITILLPIALRYLKVIPHHPSKEKGTPFECGMNTIGKTWVQFNFRFYLYALIFLVFDVLVVFLYPWAVSLRTFVTAGEGVTSLIAVFVLLAIVIVGYIYARKKGALEWD
jgi:NADH-quinone oxidoreductase subunit A